MNPSQTNHFWILWRDACRAQRWTVKDGLSTKEIDAHRHRVIKEVIGFDSSKLIRTQRDFDLIKAHLQHLASQINRTAQIQPKGRTLWYIQNIQLPCLGVYVDDVQEYLTEILRDRFKIFEGLGTIEDLSDDPRFAGNKELPSEIEMLKMTLASRIQIHRKKAGHSLHNMKALARVPCDCKECYGRVPLQAVETPETEPEPAYAGPSGGQPF